MGLFSSKKKVYVSSVVYNLAGEIAERPDFLKTVVAAGVLVPELSRGYLGSYVVDELFTGPSIRQRQFQRWSRTNFPLGAPVASIVNSQSTGGVDFTPHIPVPPGSTAEVLSSTAETADFFYWAEQHILETRPADWAGDWTCDYNSTTGEIVIEYPDTSTETITPADFVRTSYYIYVRYTLVTPDDPNPEIREPRLWIYRVGSGIAELDESVSGTAQEPEFYPFIPLRLDNKSIREPEYTETDPIFADCKKAFRKAVGMHTSIDKLLDNIEDNEQIDDIDYCFMVYGVPLNTQDNASKRYLYEFFRQLIPHQKWGALDFNNWVNIGEIRNDPLVNTIRINSADEVTSSYDMRIHWVMIDETVHTGLGKPDAKTGDVWIEKNNPFAWLSETIEGVFEQSSFDTIEMTHQTGDASYRRLRIRGLVHENYVYDGKRVTIKAEEALEDPDESGFIVPMHAPTVRSLSLLNATRVAGHNALLVFNCYEVKKLKWYQTGFFKIILVIVMVVVTIAITIASGGIGALGAATGVLGTNLAVGTALGLTGISAAIAGAVANALAAMLLTMAITQGATALFGEKFGAIIGAIASIITMQVLVNYQVTGNLAINWAKMATAENLLKLTSAVNKGVQGYVEGRIGELQSELEGVVDNYKSEMQEINKRTAELLGYSGAILDPLMFIQAQDTSTPLVESSSSFLDRTLLTGSDIAEISLGMISEFPRLSLELPKYTT